MIRNTDALRVRQLHPEHDGTIGSLERIAGIVDRVAFWMPFAKFSNGFDLGVADLQRRILADGKTVIAKAEAC